VLANGSVCKIENHIDYTKRLIFNSEDRIEDILCVQLASPHKTPHIHTTLMLPHCHNGPFIFLVILKLSDFNEETTSSLKMIWIEIETWSVLSVFKCFNINVAIWTASNLHLHTESSEM